MIVRDFVLFLLLFIMFFTTIIQEKEISVLVLSFSNFLMAFLWLERTKSQISMILISVYFCLCSFPFLFMSFMSIYADY